MANDSDPPIYRVGKGKPPKEYQFKKGQPSSNPRGRPKGSTRESQLQKMLKKKVWVTGPDGRRARKAIDEVINHKLVETAVKGDLKAIKFINELVIMHEKYQLVRQPSAAEVQQQVADDEARRKANEWVKETIMKYLDLLEKLRRYGITEPGGNLAGWVLKASAERQQPK